MPAQYLRDIADIMAERPIEAEGSLPDLVRDGWMRRSAPEIEGVEIYQAPTGELVGVASSALQRRIRRERQPMKESISASDGS